MGRPIRIYKKLSREQNHIGLSGPDDVLSLLRFGDKTHGGGGDVGLAADAFGKGNLIAGLDGNDRIGQKSTGTAIH